MKQMEIFKNPEFGTIRAVEIDGEPGLVGKGRRPWRWGTKIPARGDSQPCRCRNGRCDYVLPSTGKSERHPHQQGWPGLPWCCPASSQKQKQFRRWVYV